MPVVNPIVSRGNRVPAALNNALIIVGIVGALASGVLMLLAINGPLVFFLVLDRG